MTVVVGVAGGIGAGKSAFVRALAERGGARVTAFGDVVREEAINRGLEVTSRDVLQALGEQLKGELGDVGFARLTLARVATATRVVVDGVRHVEIAEAIALVSAPGQFFLVYLDVDDDQRRERAEVNRPDDAKRLSELALHSTENQVHDGSLRGRADMVIDASASVDALVVAVAERLGW